jgi:subtilisin family serine protease
MVRNPLTVAVAAMAAWVMTVFFDSACAEEIHRLQVSERSFSRTSITAPRELTERLISAGSATSESLASSSRPAAVATIKTEDFEGAFPNDWIVFDNNGATGGDVTWDVDAFLPFTGNWSAWAAGGGANGVPGGTNYPDNLDSWLIYGPFDLSDASAAAVDFALWMQTQSGYDFVAWVASSDGGSFNGFQWSGDSGGWNQIGFDLSSVGLLGQPQVWIAFLLQSDVSVNYAGAYIDDVIITKDTTPPSHDFDLQIIDVADGEYAPGDAFSAFTQVQNTGTTQSPLWTIAYYLSSDSAITDTDIPLGYIPDLPSLAAGETLQFNAGGPLPDPLPNGSYYLGAIVETADNNPGNNVNVDATPILVTNEPDIDVQPAAITIEGGGSAEATAESAVSGSEMADTQQSIDRLIERATERGQVDVIVGLNTQVKPVGQLTATARQAQRVRIASDQAQLMADLQGLGAQEKRRFRTIPYLALRADTRTLQALSRNPRVITITGDHLMAPTMDSSNAVIGSPLAWADGWDGSGQAVAVMDTGIDATHPWLVGKVVAEACYSTDAAGVSESLCPGGVGSSTDPGSGGNCTGVSGCDHGTHVAGTVAGNDGIGPGYGVARGGDLIAMQVFSRITSAQDCGGVAPCLLSYTSDLIAALERVLELSAGLDIAAVNMSLGGGRYFDRASCDQDNPATKAAIDNLLSAGVLTAAASGNDGFVSSTGSPGCISSAVNVGATTDDDQVASFSNIAGFVDLLAPGVDVTSSVPGGGTDSFNGTSMATPHVAGAIAVLRQYAPGVTAADLLNALKASGTPVDDNRVGGFVTDMPRINIDQALRLIGAVPASFAIANRGTGPLEVTSIFPDQSAPWLSFNPPAPFSVPRGQIRIVTPQVDFNSAPTGTTELGIVIESNDPDESPWPGGVALTVINAGGNTPHMIFTDGFEPVE